MESNTKSDNLLPWFLAFISLLTALGAPKIFPDLVQKYTEKVNPEKFPIDSSLIIKLRDSKKENNRLKREVVNRDEKIVNLTNKIRELETNRQGKPNCPDIKGTFLGKDNTYKYQEIIINQNGCKIDGAYSNPSYKQTFIGEWNQNNKSFTVIITRKNADSTCTAHMYGSIFKVVNAVKLVINKTDGLCGLPPNYPETRDFKKIQ